MKKILIFDFDGVIVESFPVCFPLMQYKYPGLTEQEYRDMHMGNVYDSIEERKRQVQPIEDPNFDFFTEYCDKIVKVLPITGIEEVLKKATKQHLPVFIVSSTTRDPIHTYLRTHKLDHYVTDIYGGDVHKSKVKKFEMILEKYDVRPEEVIFVTDTVGDVIEASKVGIQSIAVSYGFHNRELLENSPVPAEIIDRLEELLEKLSL